MCTLLLYYVEDHYSSSTTMQKWSPTEGIINLPRMRLLIWLDRNWTELGFLRLVDLNERGWYIDLWYLVFVRRTINSYSRNYYFFFFLLFLLISLPVHANAQKISNPYHIFQKKYLFFVFYQRNHKNLFIFHSSLFIF